MSVHFAPSEKRRLQRDPMCGYAANGDGVSTNAEHCTCPDCRTWLGVDDVEDKRESADPMPLR